MRSSRVLLRLHHRGGRLLDVNDPMIVLPGEFGVRLEDDMYITPSGARYFSQPSPSIDQPFA